MGKTHESQMVIMPERRFIQLQQLLNSKKEERKKEGDGDVRRTVSFEIAGSRVLLEHFYKGLFSIQVPLFLKEQEEKER